VDAVVQFSGYYDEVTAAFEQFPCKRSMYVYRDMTEVCRDRRNMDEAFFGDMYNRYDTVAVSSNDVLLPAKRLAKQYKRFGGPTADFTMCREVVDVKGVLADAEKEPVFEKVTLNLCRERLTEALNDKKIVKFVSMGSFSEDKGYERLIDAFEAVHRDYPDTCLILLGETGTLFDSLAEKIKKMNCKKAVYLIRYMLNPYPVIKACDYYVSASFYEGLGTNLADADVLGLSCIATAVPGNHDFMKQAGGYLAESSKAGIEEGLRACLNGKVPEKLDIDYEKYNQEAIAQFESLLP